MAIQGLRDTNNFVANARPQNWREGILLLFPNGNAPMTAMTSLMGSRSVDDPQFNWWEKSMATRRITLTTNPTTGTTFAMTGGGAKQFKIDDLLYVEETGEIVRVSAAPTSDTSLTVARSWGTVAATAVPITTAGVNPNVFCIGNAMQEASSAPAGIAYDPVKKTNYTQIFRDTLEATRTAIKTRLRTGDAVREAKREALLTHTTGIEKALFLGNAIEDVTGTHPQRSMGGLLEFTASANIKDAKSDYAGGVTMTGLEEYMYSIFKEGSSEKMVFCGNRALLTIQQILRKNATWEFQSGVKEFGMNVSRVTSPFGELVLKNHPLFNQVGGGTTGGTAYYGLESWMFVVDMSNLKYVYLKDSDTQYQPKLQANDLDGLKSGYLTECSIEIHHPTSHFVIKNMHGAAAG